MLGVCFIVEARNCKGKPYPLSSLQSMSLCFCVTRSCLRSRYSIWGPSKTALHQSPGNLWHDAMAVGKEKLLTMVRDMCADAGIVEKKTNHSLEWVVPLMFACNVPEKNLIQSCTGHHSLHPLCFLYFPHFVVKINQAPLSIQGTQFWLSKSLMNFWRVLILSTILFQSFLTHCCLIVDALSPCWYHPDHILGDINREQYKTWALDWTVDWTLDSIAKGQKSCQINQ